MPSGEVHPRTSVRATHRMVVGGVLMAAPAWLVALAACESGSSSPNCDSTFVDGAVDSASDGAASGEANADVVVSTDAPVSVNDASNDATAETAAAGSSVSAIRLANWSPDAPEVDFCLAPQGSTTFQGPLLSALAGDAAVIVTGLVFPLASAYVTLAPGAYVARLVVAGAASCTTGILPDLSVSALAPGQFATVALMGRINAAGGPALSLTSFLDDGIFTPPSSGGTGGSGTVPDGGTADGSAESGAKPDGGSAASPPANTIGLRFLHAAPSVGAVDFGMLTNGGQAFAALFSGLSFGQRSSRTTAAKGAPAVDPNGYAMASPLLDVELGAESHGSDAGPAATASGVSAAASSVLTVVLVDTVDGGAAPGTLVECVDNAGTVGFAGNCTSLSP